jgi:hypothetical protein
MVAKQGACEMMPNEGRQTTAIQALVEIGLVADRKAGIQFVPTEGDGRAIGYAIARNRLQGPSSEPGVEFIDENGGGPGVRQRKAETKGK